LEESVKVPLHALYQSNLNYRHLASGHQNTACSPILALSVGSKKLFGNILRPCFTPIFIVSLINVDQTIESIAGMPSAQTFPVEF
jgi:hypothetical protein